MTAKVVDVCGKLHGQLHLRGATTAQTDTRSIIILMQEMVARVTNCLTPYWPFHTKTTVKDSVSDFIQFNA